MYGLGAAALLLATGLAAALRLREPLLLDQATRVADTRGWGQGKRFNVSIRWHWLSEDEVLFDRFSVPETGTRTVYRLNTRTHREEPLPGLSKACEELSPEVSDDGAASPNGRWFAWSGRWGACLLAEVGGRRYHVYDSANTADYRAFYWLADGRHWLERYAVNHKASALVLHDTAHITYSRKLPIGDRAELVGTLACARSLQEAVSLDRPFVDVDGKSEPNEAVTVSRFSLVGPALPSARYRIRVPRGSDDYDCAVSPDGRHIAWRVTVDRPDRARAWLHRFLPIIKAPDRAWIELWLSNLDGSGMREVGVIPVIKDQNGEAPYLEMEWLPSASKLSFEYEDALYVLAVK